LIILNQTQAINIITNTLINPNNHHIYHFLFLFSILLYSIQYLCSRCQFSIS
jgi:hypothetical protein